MACPRLVNPLNLGIRYLRTGGRNEELGTCTTGFGYRRSFEGEKAGPVPDCEEYHGADDADGESPGGVGVGVFDAEAVVKVEGVVDVGLRLLLKGEPWAGVLGTCPILPEMVSKGRGIVGLSISYGRKDRSGKRRL